jgi:CheY-like chemotaxis protein
LLLDDDPPLRRLVTRLLHKEGYSVREACDGDDALEDLRAARADLVLINLSAADAGEKAVRKLRSIYPDLAIVVLAEGLPEEGENLFVLPKLSRPVAVVSFIGQALEEMAERAAAWR